MLRFKVYVPSYRILSHYFHNRETLSGTIYVEFEIFGYKIIARDVVLVMPS